MSGSTAVRPDRSIRRPPMLGVLRLAFRAGSAAAPALAARAAGVLFRLPPRHRTSDFERRVLADSRLENLRTSSGRLASWRWGEGPAVLLVHGWGSRGARLASFVEPILASGCSAVTFDAPGHGDSAGRLSSLPQFLEAISVAASRNGPFHAIVAHSMGAAAASLAMAGGLSARRAVFLAPSAHPAAYPRRFAEMLAIPPAVRVRMERNFERTLRFRWTDFEVPPRVGSLAAIPLLVFHDKDDADVPSSDGEEIARAWPGARLVTTKGLGHRRIVHDPEVVAQAISFLFDAEERQREAAP